MKVRQSLSPFFDTSIRYDDLRVVGAVDRAERGVIGGKSECRGDSGLRPCWRRDLPVFVTIPIPGLVSYSASGNGAQSGKALEVTGAVTTNDTNVEIWTNNSSANQKWFITATSRDYYPGGALPGGFNHAITYTPRVRVAVLRLEDSQRFLSYQAARFLPRSFFLYVPFDQIRQLQCHTNPISGFSSGQNLGLSTRSGCTIAPQRPEPKRCH